MGFAKECRPFVLPAVGLALLLLLLGQPAWALVAGLVALALLLFFRIPNRRPGGGPADEVLSPADGKVLRIDRVQAPDVGPGSFHRIVIFLSVFNVHVQRSPISGRVRASRYAPGRKLAAFNPAAGDVNEQQLTVLEHASGELVGIRQIAGLLARRVVSYLHTGQEIRRGELIGVIKFGSRVDLLLPENHQLEVETGQRLREGETIVARRGKGR